MTRLKNFASKVTPDKFMMGLFMLVTLVLFGWYNMTKPSILVLHSYDTSYAWVRDVNIGINRVLNNKYQYQVRWYYMDTKRHPSPEFRKSAGIAARHAIEQMRPDVVIAMDDDAQKYVSRFFNHHADIKIVYAGVNNKASDYGFDKAKNVTGILERLPLAAMKEALQSASNLRALGRPVRLAYLGDMSETVAGDAAQVTGFDWAPHQLVKPRFVSTWADWQRTILELSEQADVILLTGYRRLTRSPTDPSLVPPKEVIAWTETNSKIPVFGGNGFYTEDGGMLAIGTSPYEQGEVAARMALDIILKGKKPNDIAQTTSEQFIVTMSESKMKVRHFELPKVYEAAARTGDKYLP
jgi:ABC-type uncharacterized transport system substrate-binding protein